MLTLNTRKLAVSKPTPPGISSGGVGGVDKIPTNLMHRRKAAKRALIDARQCNNAIEQIIKLPEPGESLHFIVDGRFEPCDLIPATRRLSDPATIRRLDITTLGLNTDNVDTLARGMDAGKIGECLILVSQYFFSVDRSDYQYLLQELSARGGRVNAMRTHSKLMLMETTDGNWYTIEGSGNLRSCQSIEQFVMTNDKELLLFHRKWIEDYINTRGDGKRANKKQRKATQ